MLGSGESIKGQDCGSLELQLVCRTPPCHLAGTASNINNDNEVENENSPSSAQYSVWWDRRVANEKLERLKAVEKEIQDAEAEAQKLEQEKQHKVS